MKPGAEYGGGRVSGGFGVWPEVYAWPGFCRLEGRMNYWGYYLCARNVDVRLAVFAER